MPFFDFDPIDPDLELRGAVGPGRANRLEDRIGLASAIEKKTGAAPHAELGRLGDTLARRFAGRPNGRNDNALSAGFLGAVGAAQIRRGTDPDTVVLKDGPTRDALRATGRPDANGGFAPLPKIARPVGPRRSDQASNRPQDRRTLQGKLASLGYVPRVTETPLFPNGPAGRPSTPPLHPRGGGAGRFASDGLQILLDGVRRFQHREGLKADGLVNPGGPTERALDARNERARTARRDRLEAVNREIMESDAPEYAPITDRAAADALAGLVVANEVQDQRKARLAEPKPLSFRPERLQGGERAARGKAGGGMLAQRRTGGRGSRSGNSDPVTHGNRLGQRIREERARREREKQKRAEAEETGKDLVSQIPDNEVRGAVGRMLKDAQVTAQTGKKHVVSYRKEGGRPKAIADYYQAVRESGGKRSAIEKTGDRWRYTARDGTVIMYRPSNGESASIHGRTNEIHIVRPGEKKGVLKIRYPDPPTKEVPDGPAYP